MSSAVTDITSPGGTSFDLSTLAVNANIMVRALSDHAFSASLENSGAQPGLSVVAEGDDNIDLAQYSREADDYSARSSPREVTGQETLTHPTLPASSDALRYRSNSPHDHLDDSFGSEAAIRDGRLRDLAGQEHSPPDSGTETGGSRRLGEGEARGGDQASLFRNYINPDQAANLLSAHASVGASESSTNSASHSRSSSAGVIATGSALSSYPTQSSAVMQNLLASGDAVLSSMMGASLPTVSSGSVTPRGLHENDGDDRWQPAVDLGTVHASGSSPSEHAVDFGFGETRTGPSGQPYDRPDVLGEVGSSPSIPASLQHPFSSVSASLGFDGAMSGRSSHNCSFSTMVCLLKSFWHCGL